MTTSARVLIAAADYGLPAPPVRQGYDDPRRIWLESGDLSWRPSIEGIILPGATGLGLPPIEAITQPTPGVAGTTLTEVRVGERETFLPVYLATEGTPADLIDARTEFEEMLWPLGAGGDLRLCVQDHRGIRALPVTYVDGLTGDEGRTASGARWATLGLRFLAPDPWWQGEADRSLEFGVRGVANPFMGTTGAPNTAPWPRRLGSSSLLGQGMVVAIGGAVPVYPTLQLTGPVTSFEATMNTGWHVEIPDPILAGQTLTIVTDPRRKSIRLNGQPAAGRVALGAVLKPFQHGENVLDILAPGGNDDTLLRLSWREKYRSAWGGR